MRAKCKILYQEGQRDIGSVSVKDAVLVKLRLWSARGQDDFVLETRVKVNGKTLEHTIKILNEPGKVFSWSYYIRTAIDEYDRSVDAHYNKDKESFNKWI